jgi:metal-responsive CopG/Arc/MetJ family transcriptional regulator
MKVVKNKKKHRSDKLSFTLRLEEDLLKRLDRIAAEGDVSRQKLIASILKQILLDKDFVVQVEE